MQFSGAFSTLVCYLSIKVHYCIVKSAIRHGYENSYSGSILLWPCFYYDVNGIAACSSSNALYVYLVDCGLLGDLQALKAYRVNILTTVPF